jgi:hypothetical protein
MRLMVIPVLVLLALVAYHKADAAVAAGRNAIEDVARPFLVPASHTSSLTAGPGVQRPVVVAPSGRTFHVVMSTR